MDCNISNSPRKRRGKKEYVVNEQENEEQQPTSLILTCLRAVNEQENEEQQQNKPIEASTINQAVSIQIKQPQTGIYNHSFNHSFNHKCACEKKKTY